MSMPFNELLAKVQAGGAAAEWGKNFAELERRLFAFASEGGYERMKETAEHMAELGYYSVLERYLRILDGIEPKKGGEF